MTYVFVCAVFVFMLLGSPLGFAQDLTFAGACDASAAIVLANGDLAVADDENPDVIRRYRPEGGAIAAPSTDALETWLGQEKPKKEADLEGAVVVGERIDWIGSHSRDSDGKPEPERRALFATTLDLEPVGTLYTNLLGDLALADKRWSLGLEAAIGNPDLRSDRLAAELDGLSIEALGRLPAAGGGGRTRDTVLIGLRNPAGPDGSALLLPVGNIDAVVTDGAAPEFGEPIRLDLGGLRVRDLAWWDARRTMLVLAGTKDDHADFRLFAWSGARADRPNLIELIEGLSPEAVLPLGRDRVLLLSDDGDVRYEATAGECKDGKLEDGQCRCKHLLAQDRKSFRGRLMMLK